MESKSLTQSCLHARSLICLRATIWKIYGAGEVQMTPPIDPPPPFGLICYSK